MQIDLAKLDRLLAAAGAAGIQLTPESVHRIVLRCEIAGAAATPPAPELVKPIDRKPARKAGGKVKDTWPAIRKAIAGIHKGTRSPMPVLVNGSTICSLNYDVAVVAPLDLAPGDGYVSIEALRACKKLADLAPGEDSCSVAGAVYPVPEAAREIDLAHVSGFDGARIGVITRDDLAWLSLAMSDDPARELLNGIHFGETGAAATDGHRMHVVDCGFGLHKARENGLIMHRAGVLAALALPVDLWEVYSSTGPELRCELRSGDYRVFVREIDDQFPNYRGAIPQNLKGEIRVDAGFCERLSNRPKTKDNLAITITQAGARFRSQELAWDDDGAVIASGEVNVIAFNRHFFADAISGAGACTVYLTGNDTPALASHGNRKAVIMPMEKWHIVPR